MKNLILIALVLILTSCSSQQKKEPYKLELKNSSVNMINSMTPYTQVEQSLIGYDVEGYSALNGDSMERVKFVTLNGNEYMIIHPDSSKEKIKQITFRTDYVKKRYKMKTTLKQLKDDSLTCKKSDKTTTCIDEKEPNVEYMLKDEKLFEIRVVLN
ncbi:MAG: hypothetical protein U9N42_04470 [Campylobacterota bacterium]|nr:hypothetical protein [Campylobacterota bacterium]